LNFCYSFFAQVLNRIQPQTDTQTDRFLCISRCKEITTRQERYISRLNLFSRALKIHATRKKTVLKNSREGGADDDLKFT
jgi:hypothetical protein